MMKSVDTDTQSSQQQTLFREYLQNIEDCTMKTYHLSQRQVHGILFTLVIPVASSQQPC